MGLCQYDMREIRQTRDRLSARELAELHLKIKAYAEIHESRQVRVYLSA